MGWEHFCLIKSIFLFLANNGVNALFQSSELELNGVGKSIFKLKVLDRAWHLVVNSYIKKYYFLLSIAVNPNKDYHYLRSSMYL